VYQGLTRVYRDFICAAPPAAALQGVFKAVAGDDVERGASPSLDVVAQVEFECKT